MPALQTMQTMQTVPTMSTMQTVPTMSTMQTNILDIPTELVVQILLRLQFKDLCNLELTSAYFRNLIVEHQMYRQMLHSLPDYKVYNNTINRERMDEMQKRE